MAATGRDNKNRGSASPECPICFEARTNQRPKKQKVSQQGRLGNREALEPAGALTGGEDRGGAAEGIAERRSDQQRADHEIPLQQWQRDPECNNRGTVEQGAPLAMNQKA
jgi:hypothetical protein